MTGMKNKICIITGAASGIGQQVSIALAKQGAVVIAAARDAARASEAARAITAAAGEGARVEPLACDVSSIASMKRAAAEVLARHPKIHLLVNNAAVFNKERRTTEDGLELGYAVNTLAPYVLSTLLLDALKAGGASRIVNMSMAPTDPLNFDDLQSAKGYSALKALRSTKAGQQYLTHELAARLKGTGVSVVTVNPGLTQSKLPSEAPLPLRLIFRVFGKTPANGARVPLTACTDTTIESGAFISDKGKQIPLPAFIDAASSRLLWETNAKLAGV
jgi:NAD(P)-dependent dehydrogenase (short-subunit alcohol dehydrogenase family)